MTIMDTEPTTAGTTDGAALPVGREAHVLWLRAEGLAVLALAAVAYAQTGASWWWFAALFLLPDLAIAGYLRGPRAGAALYNVAHSHVGPVLLLGWAYTADWSSGIALALIWAAHNGFDRALGYGLKRTRGFRSTHLGAI